ncbi:MAG: preprotein translocase subunit SecY [Deltaproteobacteria bacterium]|nr:MAG: preprotein translocase subunit SecY [Deltaproteobacteria bacterium]
MKLLMQMCKISVFRYRFLYTIFLLALYRLGTFITIPGIDRYATHLGEWGRLQRKGLFSLFSFVSGGAIENASIFALGIMPYITSSIIMTMMGIIIPKIERIQKEGEKGKVQINFYVRCITILVSIIQAVMMAQYFKTRGMIHPEWGIYYGEYRFFIITVICLVAGTMMLLWLGDQISKNGIGNGVSVVIFSGIISRLPEAISKTITGLISNLYTITEIGLIMLISLIVLAGVILMEEGQRRIPLNYAKQTMLKNSLGEAKLSTLPLKINMAGVIPPIFASTILMIPMTLSSFFENNIITDLQRVITPGTWQYETILSTFIIFFAYFYTAVQFNPVDVADRLRKVGSYIPGIRPGKATSDYIDYVLIRLTFIGSLYLCAICIMPLIISKLAENQIPFYIGGTGMLIVVSVALEIIRQVKNFSIRENYQVSSKKYIRARQDERLSRH